MTNVVIGAGSGMGTAVARVLAPRGELIVADQNLEAVAALAAELGGAVTPVACDITAREQIDALVARIGTLDAIVLTGGNGFCHPAASWPCATARDKRCELGSVVVLAGNARAPGWE